MANEQIGGWAFIAGVIIAILVGLVPLDAATTSYATLVMVVLGLVVGFLNVPDKETTPFLIAAIALLAAGNAGLSTIPAVGSYVTNILSNIVAFVAPAAVVVALKQVYTFASK